MAASQTYFVSLPKVKKYRGKGWEKTYISSLVIAFIMTLLQFNLLEVLRVDRGQHFVLSMALFVMFSYMGKSFKFYGATFILVFTIGFLKEVIDPSFEWFDIYANCFGLLVGSLVVYATGSLNKIRPLL